MSRLIPAALVALLARAGVEATLFWHAMLLLATTILGQLLSFVVQIPLARHLGIESYGVYNYTFVWVNLLTMVGIMGHDRLLIRYASEYRIVGNTAKLWAIVRWSAGLTTVSTAILAIGFGTVSLTLMGSTADLEWVGAVLWGALCLPFLVAGGLLESLLRSCGAHAAANWPGHLFRPALFGLLIVATSAGGMNLNASTALALNTVSTAATCVVGAKLLWPLLPAAGGVPEATLPRSAWLATALAFGANTVTLYLNGQLDTLILGLFHDQAVVGLYAAVIRLVVILSFPSSAVIVIIQPMIVHCRSAGSSADLQRLVASGALLVFLPTAGLTLVILLFAEPILAIFGPDFVAGASALRILSLAYLGSSLVSLSSSLLNMTGYHGDSTLIMLAGMMVTALLNVLLIPAYGTMGAAIATGLSTLLWNLGLFLAAWARLGILAAPVFRLFPVRIG